MAFVTIPFKSESLKEKKATPQRKVVESYGGVTLSMICGDWEVWVNGKLVLGPVSEEQARCRFLLLKNPQEDPLLVRSPIKSDPDRVYQNHPCPSCGEPVSDERQVLTGMVTCPACTQQPPKLLGVMVYTHKSTAELVITSDVGLLKQLKKPANRQR